MTPCGGGAYAGPRAIAPIIVRPPITIGITT